jgi:hypothetical protein
MRPAAMRAVYICSARSPNPLRDLRTTRLRARLTLRPRRSPSGTQPRPPESFHRSQPIDRWDELRHGVSGDAGLVAQDARHGLRSLPGKAVAHLNLMLEIHVHPDRLMIGTGSVGVDARQDGRGVDATGALPMALHFLQAMTSASSTRGRCERGRGGCLCRTRTGCCR